jgi:hypothetical protein
MTIAALLEHMQRNMARQSKLPSQAEFKDKKDELAFK